MRRHRFIVTAALVALVPLVSCDNDRTESSATPPTTGASVSRIEQASVPGVDLPTVPIGDTVTVSVEVVGSTEGVIGTADVTVSNFAPLPHPRIEKYPPHPTALDHLGYTVLVEIETRAGEFPYNALYFSLRTPGGAIYVASTPGLDDDLGSGTLRTGESRCGSLLFEIPPGADPAEVVLVDTDDSTPVASWTLD
ncbi:hypothetical protein [Rhodococcus sp. NPDC058639]|uniref:hypothetical protein n=1 Tax=Rhodococcus sp. NPDC058639 TaxID=3346570 RepID=UPI00365677C8